MAADYSLLLIVDYGCKRQAIEGIIDPLEDTIGITYVFVQSLCAFLTKSKELVDHSVLMVASQ